MDILKKLAESKKLPAGHYGKKEAQAAVDKVYHACFEQEKELKKQYRIKKRHFEPQEAFDLCVQICNAVGQKPIKKLVLNSDTISPYAGGEYVKGEIHLPSRWVDTGTLFHELTHHFCSYGTHGTHFLEMQALVYEAAMLCAGKELTKG